MNDLPLWGLTKKILYVFAGCMFMLQEISLVEMQIYPQENVKMSLREGVQRIKFFSKTTGDREKIFVAP